MRGPNRYSAIIQHLFFSRYKEGVTEIYFAREEFAEVAIQLGIVLPKNVGDILYSFRYRAALPEAIRTVAPEGSAWMLQSVGRGRYRMVLRPEVKIIPSSLMAETKIPDSTPGVILMYSQNDEQALLAKLRYNRLIDLFTGVTSYSLQSHLRTTVPRIGQIETDEIYIGVDRRGAHYVFPVQAKGGSDKLHIVQIEQDMALCANRFPALICRAIAAQFMRGDVIALFEFEESESGAALVLEKHYRLVPPQEVTSEDLHIYRERLPIE